MFTHPRRIGLLAARTVGTSIALMAGTAAVAHADEAPDHEADAWSTPGPADAPGTAAPVDQEQVAAPTDQTPPVEAVPAEAPPVEAPVETYAETAPVETAPVETAPVEAEVGNVEAERAPEHAPADPAPVEADQVEIAPTDSAPVEAAPVEAAPVETAPVEAAPHETAPVEAAPAETTPAEVAPEQGVPTDIPAADEVVVHDAPTGASAEPAPDGPPVEAAQHLTEVAPAPPEATPSGPTPAEADQQAPVHPTPPPTDADHSGASQAVLEPVGAATNHPRDPNGAFAAQSPTAPQDPTRSGGTLPPAQAGAGVDAELIGRDGVWVEDQPAAHPGAMAPAPHSSVGLSTELSTAPGVDVAAIEAAVEAMAPGSAVCGEGALAKHGAVLGGVPGSLAVCADVVARDTGEGHDESHLGTAQPTAGRHLGIRAAQVSPDSPLTTGIPRWWADLFTPPTFTVAPTHHDPDPAEGHDSEQRDAERQAEKPYRASRPTWSLGDLFGVHGGARQVERDERSDEDGRRERQDRATGDDESSSKGDEALTEKRSETTKNPAEKADRRTEPRAARARDEGSSARTVAVTRSGDASDTPRVTVRASTPSLEELVERFAPTWRPAPRRDAPTQSGGSRDASESRVSETSRTSRGSQESEASTPTPAPSGPSTPSSRSTPPAPAQAPVAAPPATTPTASETQSPSQSPSAVAPTDPIPVATSGVTRRSTAPVTRPATPPTSAALTQRPDPSTAASADVVPQVPAPLPSRRYDQVPVAPPAHQSPTPAPRRTVDREWPSGVYLDTEDSLQIPQERGRPADVFVVPVDGRSWETMVRLETPVDAPTGSAARLVLATPLIPDTGATWQQCAMGEYEDRWTRVGTALATYPVAPIVDLGGAMNEIGPEVGSPAAFAACFAEVSRTIKSVAPEVAIQWTPAVGSRPGMPGEAVLSAWPGREYVDVIGVDARAQELSWAQTVNGAYGLNHWASFADRQGKRIAVTRWGVHEQTPADGVNEAYVRHVHDWIASVAAKQALAYEAYSEPAQAPADVVATYRGLF